MIDQGNLECGGRGRSPATPLWQSPSHSRSLAVHRSEPGRKAVSPGSLNSPSATALQVSLIDQA
jgi:hypothetical protein